MRPIAWMGSAFNDLLSFPEAIRKDAGFQLHRLQAGLEAAGSRCPKSVKALLKYGFEAIRTLIEFSI
ncbi:hypothetical protein [Enterobacter soli]